MDTTLYLAPWIGSISKLVDNHLQENLQSQGIKISKEQILILDALTQENGVNQNELASLIHRDKSTLTRLLAKMESKGLIHREQYSLDRRINKIYLNPKGRNVLKEVRPIMLNVIHSIEEDISEAEKRQLIKSLKKIRYRLKLKKVL